MSEQVAVTDTPYAAVVATSMLEVNDLATGAQGAAASSEDQHYYQQILPEARGLTWEDDFFDGEDEKASGVVAVFDFDYEEMEDFQTKVAVAMQVSFVFIITAYLALFLQDLWFLGLVGSVTAYGLTLAPCFVRYQIRWRVRAQHLAVTRDDIRFVQDRRQTCWGLAMCDRGKHSKTVPFDKITDCDIEEPAGNAWLCIPRVLVTVNVDTASSGGGEGKVPELHISGLREPHKFKVLVWAMKRCLNDKAYCAPTTTRENYYQAPRVVEMGERKDPTTPHHDTAIRQSSSGEVKTLLTEIRDELHENNRLLRTMRQSDQNPSSATQVADATTTTVAEVSEEQGSHREIV